MPPYLLEQDWRREAQHNRSLRPCSDRSQQAADMKEGHPKLDRPDTVAFNQMQVERWCAVGKSSCNIKPDLASDFVVDGSVGPSIE